MNRLKNSMIAIGTMLISILIITFLVTILNYFGILSKNIVSIFKIIIPMVSLFIGGFAMGRKSYKKGWLEGILLSIIFIIILILFNTLGLGNKIELRNLLYYLIMIISCMFGSMLGINKKIET